MALHAPGMVRGASPGEARCTHPGMADIQAGRQRKDCGAERSMPLRQRQKIQEVLRKMNSKTPPAMAGGVFAGEETLHVENIE